MRLSAGESFPILVIHRWADRYTACRNQYILLALRRVLLPVPPIDHNILGLPLERSTTGLDI
jgi:hypothetical protein